MPSVKKIVIVAVEIFVAFLFFGFWVAKKIWIDLVWETILVKVFSLCLGNKSPVRKVISTPEVRFQNLPDYKFTPNYFSFKDVKVHYVDEGPKDASRTILCLHGEPSWSFLYRKMIPLFVEQGYRVIAPDFIGFGKSDKYTDPNKYNYELHRETLVSLCQFLKLNNATLVVQDWGGLIGLGCLPALESHISELVIMNTGLPPSSKKPSFLGILPLLDWLLFVRLVGTYLPIGLLFSGTLKNASADVIRGYEAPFPNHWYKAGAYAFPLLVPVPFLQPNTAVVEGGRKARDTLRKWEKPALILFSDQDPISRPMRQDFIELLPKANSEKWIRGGGHFLQEDKGEDVAKEIIDFLKNC